MSPATLQGLRLKLVLLAQGGRMLALESRLVRGCRQQPPQPQRTDTPVIQLDQFADVDTGHTPPLLLELKQDAGPVVGLWSGTADLIEVPATAIAPLPPSIATRKLWPALKALVIMDDQVVPLLDVSMLSATWDNKSGPPTSSEGR